MNMRKETNTTWLDQKKPNLAQSELAQASKQHAQSRQQGPQKSHRTPNSEVIAMGNDTPRMRCCAQECHVHHNEAEKQKIKQH